VLKKTYCIDPNMRGGVITFNQYLFAPGPEAVLFLSNFQYAFLLGTNFLPGCEGTSRSTLILASGRITVEYRVQMPFPIQNSK
jgi:hypothetical protein